MIWCALDLPDPKACFKYPQHIHITYRKFSRALWSWQTALRSWRYLEYSTWFGASFWQNWSIFTFSAIKSFLRFQRWWFDVRWIPLIPRYVLNAQHIFIAHTEIFYSTLKLTDSCQKLTLLRIFYMIWSFILTKSINFYF